MCILALGGRHSSMEYLESTRPQTADQTPEPSPIKEIIEDKKKEKVTL